eukprot:ctg_2897.g689
MPSERAAPVSQRVDAWMEGAPDAPTDGSQSGRDNQPRQQPSLFLDPKAATTSRPSTAPARSFREAVVFLVGGGCYAEYQNLREHFHDGRRIMYGATEMVSPTAFLQQLSELGGSGSTEGERKVQDERKGSGECGICSAEHGREYVGGEGLAGRTGRPGHSSIRTECTSFTGSVRSTVDNLRCGYCSPPILILCARQDAQGRTEALSRAGGRQRVACCARTPPLPEQQVAAAAPPLEAAALAGRPRRCQDIAHARPVIGGESSLRVGG